MRPSRPLSRYLLFCHSSLIFSLHRCRTLQILRAKGGKASQTSFFDISNALVEADRYDEAKSMADLFRQDHPNFSPEEQSQMDKILANIRRRTEAAAAAAGSTAGREAR